MACWMPSLGIGLGLGVRGRFIVRGTPTARARNGEMARVVLQVRVEG